jgi:hypothetical protein
VTEAPAGIVRVPRFRLLGRTCEHGLRMAVNLATLGHVELDLESNSSPTRLGTSQVSNR